MGTNASLAFIISMDLNFARNDKEVRLVHLKYSS